MWLRKSGRPFWFTLLPMAFVLSITLWALVIQFGNFTGAVLERGLFGAGATSVNAIAAFLLILIALLILDEARRNIWRAPLEPQAAK
jgi:carbon starvation protein